MLLLACAGLQTKLPRLQKIKTTNVELNFLSRLICRKIDGFWTTKEMVTEYSMEFTCHLPGENFMKVNRSLTENYWKGEEGVLGSRPTVVFVIKVS